MSVNLTHVDIHRNAQFCFVEKSCQLMFFFPWVHFDFTQFRKSFFSDILSRFQSAMNDMDRRGYVT